jgi:glucosamine-6-phosphate deaminase
VGEFILKTMEVIIKPDAAAVSKTAAQYFKSQLEAKPESVLGLATGSTPLGLYRELIALYQARLLDFSRAVSFNLDEYTGLPADHPGSYHSFMRENLFSQINLPSQNSHLPDGMAADVPAHCAAYEEAIKRAGGIDLQLLGLGSDGHIGFNEPSSSLSSRTRLKTLTPRTIVDNAAYFGGGKNVPHHVITMGVGTIMEARHCLVLAIGPKKAAAVAAMAEGPITATCPASILQMHIRCTLIVDEPAAAALQRSDYYRWVYENKPDWQRGGRE